MAEQYAALRLSDGDRLPVAMSRRVSATREMSVLSDCGRMVIKRVKPVNDASGASPCD